LTEHDQAKQWREAHNLSPAPRISQERLKALLSYDPATGIFMNLVTRRSAKKGKRAGWINAYGYRCVRLDGRTYYMGPLAWFYVTGYWPKDEIDHRNLNKRDDSFSNLREATRSQNCANKRVQKTSVLGIKGVHFRFGRYIAIIKKAGKLRHLGCFATLELARAAYRAAAQELHGEFTRG
jgi:hypothetical protein